MAEENEFEKMAEIVMQNMIAVPKYTNGKDDCRYSKQSKIIARALREVHNAEIGSAATVVFDRYRLCQVVECEAKALMDAILSLKNQNINDVPEGRKE